MARPSKTSFFSVKRRKVHATLARMAPAPMAPIIVQKYGGSSVADIEKIRAVARKVKARRDEGAQLVVVVSAMGDTTDELLALAKQISADPPRRELDMLLTCGERIS